MERLAAGIRSWWPSASPFGINRNTPSARIRFPPEKGANEEQIGAVLNFEKGPFSEKEKLGFRLADLLHQGASTVNDTFYVKLRGVFSEAEIMELFLTAAAFEMFPRFVDGLRLPVTPIPPAK